MFKHDPTVGNMIDWQEVRSHFAYLEEVFMAQFSQQEWDTERKGWQGRAMPEEDGESLL